MNRPESEKDILFYLWLFAVLVLAGGWLLTAIELRTATRYNEMLKKDIYQVQHLKN